jgi:hypothetical protein
MVEYGLVLSNSVGATAVTVGGVPLWTWVLALVAVGALFVLPKGLIAGALVGVAAAMFAPPLLGVDAPSWMPVALVAVGGLGGYAVAH